MREYLQRVKANDDYSRQVMAVSFALLNQAQICTFIPSDFVDHGLFLSGLV